MTDSKTLVTIIGDDAKITKLVQRDQLLKVLNTPPPKNWIKDHPLASGVKYMPIDKTELLLTRIFQEWFVEVKEVKQLFNSICVTITLHYKDPIDGEWRRQEGIGAIAAQTDKGKSPADLSAIKNDAVMKGAPAAESFAIKDAAEKIGKIFGKDLNRKDVMAFKPSYDTDEAKQKVKDKLNEDN